MTGGVTCPNCGKIPNPDREWPCNHCGEPFRRPVGPVGRPDLSAYESGQDVVVRSYPGHSQQDAARPFAAEASLVATLGYFPATQSWGEGQPGLGRFLVLGLSANVLKPDGVLTVTYRRGETPSVTKVCPDCAETVKADARICRFCRHEFPAG